MSRKQIRIDSQAQISKGLPELLNKNINVVLTDSTVQFGKLEKADTEALTLKNMRLRTIRIPIKKIFEIYSDVEA
jgi:hypothetical protein